MHISPVARCVIRSVLIVALLGVGSSLLPCRAEVSRALIELHRPAENSFPEYWSKAASPNIGLAGCKQRLLGETGESFIRLLAFRMEKAGINKIEKVDERPGESDYVLWQSGTVLIVVSTLDQDGILTMVVINMTPPSHGGDEERFIQAIEFTIAHFSDGFEQEIDKEVRNIVISARSYGDWPFRHGTVLSLFQKQPASSIMAITKVDCP